MKVLIIDDEEDVRYIVRLGLGRVGGMIVLEAANAKDGIALARRERPDCVLLDLMMPTLSGTAVLQALRDAPETADIPIIFLTAAGRAYDIDRLHQLGAKGVILKPFDPLKLADEIRSILEQ